MGGSGVMQRSSTSTVRTVMALCLGSLVVVTVLYLAKRVEVNKTLRELDMVKIENRDITEGYNIKIGEYVEKIESLTQQSTVIGGQLKNCKDNRDSLVVQTQKLKGEKDVCQNDLRTATKDRVEAEAAMDQMKSERDSALSGKQGAESELEANQEENANLQTELDECESENERLHSQSDDQGMCTVQLATAQSKLRSLTEREAVMLSQVKTLTDEKKTLEDRVSKMLAQTPPQPASRARLMKHAPPQGMANRVFIPRTPIEEPGNDGDTGEALTLNDPMGEAGEETENQQLQL